MLIRYFGGKAVEARLEQLKDIITEAGTQKMWNHAKLVEDPEHGKQVLQWQRWVQQNIEGPDCWYIVLRGTNVILWQATRPALSFQCTLTYDDTGDTIEIGDTLASLQRLVEQNKDSPLIAAKATRLSLRAMARPGVKIKYPWKEGRYESINVGNEEKKTSRMLTSTFNSTSDACRFRHHHSTSP